MGAPVAAHAASKRGPSVLLARSKAAVSCSMSFTVQAGNGSGELRAWTHTRFFSSVQLMRITVIRNKFARVITATLLAASFAVVSGVTAQAPAAHADGTGTCVAFAQKKKDRIVGTCWKKRVAVHYSCTSPGRYSGGSFRTGNASVTKYSFIFIPPYKCNPNKVSMNSI